MNRNAYTPITADPVLLRLNSCRDWGTLHQRIRKAFGFPDYYGENWDAMWDCLTDVFLQPVQRHIVVEGFDAMPQELRAYAAPMAGDLQRPSGEISLGLGHIPLIIRTTKPVGSRREEGRSTRAVLPPVMP